jgi:hypothetical protein
MPKGDVDSDGDCDAADDSIVNGWVGVTYDVRGDIDLDDDVDAGDYAAVQAVHQALGRGVLTAIGIGNRKTHAGYELAFVIGPQCHVRQRISSAALGRWHRRDPQGYQDSLSLYELLRSAPANTLDPFGLCVIPCPGYEDRHVSGSGPMCVNATSTWPSNDLMIEVVTNHHKNDCACEDKTPNTHEFCDCELGYSYNNLLITMGPAYQEWQYRPWVLGAPMPPPKLMQCRDITYEFDAFWICTTLCDGGPLVAIARVNNSLSALSASLNGVSY